MKILIFLIHYIFVNGSKPSNKNRYYGINKKTVANTKVNKDSLTSEKINIDQNIFQKDKKIAEIHDLNQFKMVFEILNLQATKLRQFMSTYEVKIYTNCIKIQSTVFKFFINFKFFILIYFKVKTDIDYEKWTNNETNNVKKVVKFNEIKKNKLLNLKNSMKFIFIKVKELQMIYNVQKAIDQDCLTRINIIIKYLYKCLIYANDISAYKINKISIEEFDEEDLTKLKKKLKENVPIYF